MVEDNPVKHEKELGWRVPVSIITGVGWLVFIIIWLAFFAGGLDSINKNIAIFFASILALIGIMGATWASYGIRQIPKEGRELMKTTGMKSRTIASIIVFVAFMLFLIIWFYYYADSYDIYQNIAVFLTSILIMGAIMGVMWARWGMRHSHDFGKQAAYYNKKHHCKDEDETEKKD